MRLIYFSPVPWTSFTQRPHEFVEWFRSKSLDSVLWIEPYPTRLPTWNDFRRIRGKRVKSAAGAKRDKPTWLRVIRPRSIPVEPLPGGGWLNNLLWHGVHKEIDQFFEGGRTVVGIGKPSELAVQVLRRYQCKRSFFDVMDDVPLFYKGLSRVVMKRRMGQVASAVSQLMVSSSALIDRFSAHSSKITVVHNACAINSMPPADSISKRGGRPVLGYVGTIGYWFDWSFVLALAATFPSMLIRLIGPVFAIPEEPLPDNVELLPPCDHATAISAMQEFSVGLIPFRRNDLTASVDPIKFYEYRALGLPVISTRFGEMAERSGQPGVFISDTHSDLAGLVRLAMDHKDEAEDMQKFRSANSWSTRFDRSGILD